MRTYLSIILCLSVAASLWADEGAASKKTERQWDARAIVGWQQAGASSAESKQHFFFDFFVVRPFGDKAVFNHRFNLWGQVRIASSPQQVDIPLSQFAVNFKETLGAVKVNEMAQSAEFLSGFEWRPFKEWGSEKSGTVRTIGLVGFFGAKGAFSDPSTQGRVFRIPSTNSPQWVNFQSHPIFRNADFPAGVDYVGLIPPDRERFYRQYGVGFRYTSYSTNNNWESPSMFTITIGQDQSVTRGRYVGPVLKFDAFYPLPWKDSSYLFLFGTANLAVAKPSSNIPLALEPVSDTCPSGSTTLTPGQDCDVKLYQDNVAIFNVPSSRDNYRIGVGIDCISFLRWLTEKGVKTGNAP